MKDLLDIKLSLVCSILSELDFAALLMIYLMMQCVVILMLSC